MLLKNKIDQILERVKSILFVALKSSSKVKSTLKFVLYLIIFSVILGIYGSVVYSDPYYIKEKYPQRFAIDGESLDLSSQFKEIDLSLDTKIDYYLQIKSSDFYTEEPANEVTVIEGKNSKIYKNVNFRIYSNVIHRFEFNNPSHLWFRSKPDNNKWVRLKLMKDDKFYRFERYDLNISNIEYNKELNLFVRMTEDDYFFELQNSEVIITSGKTKEKLFVKEGSIKFNGTSAIRFYNVSNIFARNISGIDFNENTKIDSLNFTNGFGTFALGQSHFQFTPIDEIRIVSSENISPLELKIDLVRKTFKASGYVNSLTFNGKENILTNYQNILRDPTFIAAIVGAIIGGLITLVFSRK